MDKQQPPYRALKSLHDKMNEVLKAITPEEKLEPSDELVTKFLDSYIKGLPKNELQELYSDNNAFQNTIEGELKLRKSNEQSGPENER